MQISTAWDIRPFRWDVAEGISRELNLPLLVGVVMARRGFSGPEEAHNFLYPDGIVPSPFLLGGVTEAVDRIAAHLDAGSRVVVYGDYDVDGISAGALMVLGLRELGMKPECILPNRFEHGYGLSAGAVHQLAAGGPGLLITVDCGVNYPEEVALAQSLGMEVVVTDHHTLGETMPRAVVVHPRIREYPGSDLCGVGVAFKLLHGLHVRLRGELEDRVPPSLRSLLDLVALGTIADIVPLIGENRYYVKEGLRRMAWGARPGLRALMDVSNCVPESIDTAAVAYRIAPRLNAPGRLDSPDLPLKLLLTEDMEEARVIAARLNNMNRERQEVEAAILKEALALAEKEDPASPALVLAGEGWHEGVVGIVASRLVEKFYRPVVLLALAGDRAKGSGRSIPAYDLISGLTEASHLLDVYGGHKQAAGLTLHRARVDELRTALVADAAASLTQADLTPVYAPDAIVSGTELTLDTAEALGLLGPFGAGNPQVRLLALGAEFDNVACTRNGDHLLCALAVDGLRIRGIGFGLAKTLSAAGLQDSRRHAALRLEANRWNDIVRPEVVIHSLFDVNEFGEDALGCAPDCPYLDDLLAPPACAHCSEPLAGLDTVHDVTEVPGRDLRGAGMQLSTIAQVVSAGEPTAIVACSVTPRLGQVAGRVPFDRLGVPGVDCVGRLCWRTRLAGLRSDSLLFVDWTAAGRRADLLKGRRHIIVLDPPYHASHTALLHLCSDAGATIHLCYGPEEREFTERFLRASTHPRTWMVPLYRALRGGAGRDEALRIVAREAWDSGSIPPSRDELQRAWRILAALGLTESSQASLRLDPSAIPEYAEGEAEYEEAVRLCRTL